LSHVAYKQHPRHSLVEPCADFVVSAEARRSILIGDGGGGVVTVISYCRILVSNVFQQRTFQIQLCNGVAVFGMTSR